MRAKSGVAVLFVVLISTLAFCIFAQVQPDKQQEELRKSLLLQKSQVQNQSGRLSQEQRQQTVQKTMLIDKKILTLLKAEIGGDGKVAYIRIPPTEPNSPITYPNPILRIKMLDGSIQEIRLFEVKEVTIEQSGDIR